MTGRLGVAARIRCVLSDVQAELPLTAQPNWGCRLRRGLVPLDEHDVDILRERMPV